MLKDYPLQLVLKTSLLSIPVGVAAGASVSIFLIFLAKLTEIRLQQSALIYLLPLAGIVIGQCYYKLGQYCEDGNSLIIKKIHRPKSHLPLAMAPLIFITTLITHLFGGSAGREGTAVQLGASFGDYHGRFYKLSQKERRVLLIAGTGAGFGAAMNAPLAGIIFGMEVLRVGKIKLPHLLQCTIASFCAYFIAALIGTPHLSPSFFWSGPLLSLSHLGIALISGLIFGLITICFIFFKDTLEKYLTQLIPDMRLRPFIGGVLIVFLFWLEGSYQYAGLGLSNILESFSSHSSFLEPIYKLFFTALTLASGFKGGEFTPLVFIGSTLGSYLSFYLSMGPSFLAALGFVSVFAAASKTPLACSFMAVELFGLEILPYTLICCYTATWITGKLGIYSHQPYYKKTLYEKTSQ